MYTHLFTQLTAQKRAAINAYQYHRQPLHFFRRYSKALDEVLTTLFEELFSGSHGCLLALGGYGRGEMYPHSDIDLALVFPHELSASEQEKVEQWVQILWDANLSPALKSGSLKQLASAARHDLTTDTAFLEARFLCGNATFAQTVIQTFNCQRDTVSFMESKLLEMQQRHAKQPSLTLEPNVKNCAGGLRDMHTILWLMRAQNLQLNFHSLISNRIITRTEAGLLRRCHRHLARIRMDLHITAQREEDRLIFDLQAKLARAQHKNSTRAEDGIERLMHGFYRTAKTVLQLNGILIPMLRGRVYSPYPRVIHDIDANYFQVGNKIAVKDIQLFERQPEHIFTIIESLQNRRDLNGIAPKTLRAWWAALRHINAAFYQNPVNRARFLGFFQTGTGLTHIMRFLNIYGVLSRYLPQWHKIVGLLQHDLFHIYPVDDHILTVLRNLRRLAMEEHSHELPTESTLMLNFDRKYVLYLAAMFHDIAKGRNGEHAQLGVQDALHFAHDHNLPEHDTQLLTFLVRHHLLLSQTAQKEDIHDPEVIARFCQYVNTPEKLTALYLLTVADIRGTNPKIWNSWKAQLLQTLFQAALAHLLSGSLKSENDLSARYRQATDFLTTQGYTPQAIRQLFNALGQAYFARHNSQLIMQQLPHIAAAPNEPHINVCATNHHDNLSILVYMPNAERLFTRLCRLFGQHHLNIVAARAFVTAHDFILDNFIVSLPENSDEADIQRIQAGLIRDLRPFIYKHIMPRHNKSYKPSRRARLLPIAPRVHIQHDDDEKGRYTLEIVAVNRPNLLADVTEVLARHNIRLHYAKIATLGERVEDSFLVFCPELDNASTEFTVKQDLLAAIG